MKQWSIPFASSVSANNSAVAGFFVLKLLSGVVLLMMGARYLSVPQFSVFTQLLILLAFAVTVATVGLPQGVIRQTAAPHENRSRTLRAAIVIWLAASLIILAVSFTLNSALSVLLTGTETVSGAVSVIGALSVIGGLGAILCARLTGEGRVAASMAAQAAGLVAATGSAAFFLYSSDAESGAIGFAAGPTITTAIAIWFLRPSLIRSWRFAGPIRDSVRELMQFSGAFLVVASIMPITLILARSFYLETFGLEFLGYWLAANRVSDVNTQLIGLYFTQKYLPKATRSLADPVAAAKLISGTALSATAAMIGGLGVFAIAREPLIELFLSSKFVPAAGIIIAYLIGDTLRVMPSLWAFSALARKKFSLYMLIEALAAAAMGGLIIAFTWADRPDGPAIAYIATYAVLTAMAIAYHRRYGLLRGVRSPRAIEEAAPE